MSAEPRTSGSQAAPDSCRVSVGEETGITGAGNAGEPDGVDAVGTTMVNLHRVMSAMAKPRPAPDSRVPLRSCLVEDRLIAVLTSISAIDRIRELAEMLSLNERWSVRKPEFQAFPGFNTRAAVGSGTPDLPTYVPVGMTTV